MLQYGDFGWLPEEYNMSETYQVTISFTGGPSAEGNANLGGFNLWASGGEITPLDATVQSMAPLRLLTLRQGTITHHGVSSGLLQVTERC